MFYSGQENQKLFVYWSTNFVYVAMVIVYNGRWIFIWIIYCVSYIFVH